MKTTRRAFLSTVIAGGTIVATSLDAAAKNVELLEFRLAKAKRVHLHDEKMAKSYDKSFKSLGIACELHQHDGHFDLAFECPKWKQAEFATHAEVEKWEKWLKALGFETKHSH